MKRVIFLFLLFLPIALAQPFGPPIYIGNPNTGECKYYFAGDPEHFNERPEGYPDNIDLTTKFDDQAQACSAYRCFIAGGGFDKAGNQCICSNGQIYDNNTMGSCPASSPSTDTPKETNDNEITGAVTGIPKGLQIERVILLVLALGLIGHFIYSKNQNKKLLNEIKKGQERKEPIQVEETKEPEIKEETKEEPQEEVKEEKKEDSDEKFEVNL